MLLGVRKVLLGVRKGLLGVRKVLLGVRKVLIGVRLPRLVCCCLWRCTAIKNRIIA